ncbi:MAG: DUF4118 domain-containing protein, partial [Planctomycetota bacterium]
MVRTDQGGLRRKSLGDDAVILTALYYASAVTFVGAAAALRWAMPSVLEGTPFLAFYPAVVAAAMLGGFGPGVVATVGSLLCYALWFDRTPAHTFR